MFLKRLVSILLALTMVLALLPGTAFAADDPVAVQDEASLIQAIGDASDGDTIQLAGDITDVASAITIDKSITLDLNTHTLSGDGVKDGFVIINAPNGNVTIKNGVLTLAGTSAYNGYDFAK